MVSSKNLVLSFLRFSCGMRFRILVVWSGESCDTWIIRVLGGIFRIIGK